MAVTAGASRMESPASDGAGPASRVTQSAHPLAEWRESELDDPRLYFNRELSLLCFTRRVLELARDPEIPLLERVRFLCISCTNLDEFFEVRVASIRQRLQHGATQSGTDGLTPTATLEEWKPP